MAEQKSGSQKEAKSKYDVVETAAGWIGIEVTDKGIKRLTLPAKTEAEALAACGVEKKDLTPGAGGGLADRLMHFFLGEPIVFNAGF